MTQDTARLINDINVIFSTLYPDSDSMKIALRLEEVACNYDINRKTFIEVEQDIAEKTQLYLSSKKLEGLSNNTLKSYKIELRIFADYFNKACVQITTSDIRNFLSSRSDLKMSSISRRLSVLKSFFGWLVQEEMLLRDPTTKIKTPKKEKRLPKGLSIEELEMVRESCNTLRQRAIMEVFYSTGCRLSEIANMNINDINFQSMTVNVIGKGDKERVAYLSHKAVFHLNKYLNFRGDNIPAVFITERKPHRRMGNRAIQREVDKIEIASNISKSLTCHVFRHTFATLSMDGGIDLADLQQLMGHSNPSTTLIYSNVSEERKRSAFKKYHVQ